MSDESENKPPGNSPIKGIAAGAGLTMLGGGLLAAVYFHKTLIIAFLVALLVFLVLAAAIIWFLGWRKNKKQEKGLGGGLLSWFDSSNSSNEVRQRLEQMKRKFMLLIDRLQSQGQKNIYEMPWFLTIGPSGTGKSWVLKGAGLERLRDEEESADEDDWQKGTLLIDWWTSADALVLDTAGGVVFGEEYDMPEWKSLLGLLRKHRPQCPINGIYVIIPSQLLLLADDELPERWYTLEKYAETLRLQIRQRLQRQLGIRFPVYFLVTQSDRIPGFREFSGAVKETGGNRDQMLGWSNPVPVGAAVSKPTTLARSQSDPELEAIAGITEHLRHVAQEVRQYRLNLLDSYVGTAAQADGVGMDVRERAADLFSFADIIQNTIAPRMEEFLGKVFRKDPSLPKPPYVRGVYFTSALREGVVLDRARAKVVGRSMAELALPGAAGRKQVNPFFLKDLIFNKSFAESWLVTPLVEARQYLKHKRRMLIWSSIAASLVFLIAIGWSAYNYKITVADELSAWKDVTNQLGQRYWLPVINSNSANYTLNETNLEQQSQLARNAFAGTKSAGFQIFFPSSDLNTPRRQAQTKLFERGVILPLADAAHAKILKPISPAPAANDFLPQIQNLQNAIVGMLELELCPSNNWKDELELKASGRLVVNGLGRFVIADPKDNDINLLNSDFTNTYHGRQSTNWPPTDIRNPEGLTSFVTKSFERLQTLELKQSTSFKSEKKDLVDLLETAKKVDTAENLFYDSIRSFEAVPDLKEKPLADLSNAWKEFDTQNVKKFQSLKMALSDFTNKVVMDYSNRNNEFDVKLKQVHRVPNSTNFWLVEKSLKSLNQEASSKQIDMLTNFGGQWSLAQVLDQTFILPFQPPGQEGQAETQRPMDKRLELYNQMVTLPLESPQSHILQTGRDPWIKSQKLETVAKEGTQNFWALLPTNSLAGYHMTSAGELIRYVNYLHLTNTIEELAKETTAWLDRIKPGFDIKVSAANSFKTTSKMLEEMASMSNLWSDVEQNLDKNFHKSSETISTNLTTFAEKRTQIIETLTNGIANEQIRAGNLPFKYNGKVSTVKEVKDSLEIAKKWSKTIEEQLQPMNGVQEKFESGEIEWLRSEAEQWLGHFDRLVDRQSTEVIEYNIMTPSWSKPNELKSVITGGPSQYAEANKAVGIYRYVKVGNDKLETDNEQSFISVTADQQFELKVYADINSPEATIENLSTTEGWTIIDLINRRSIPKADHYYVPLKIRDKNNSTIWLVVKPTSKNNR